MVRASAGLAVGEELHEAITTGADERERRDGREGLPGEVTGKEQAAEGDGLGSAVEKLKPIAPGHGIGHPFVDCEAGGIAEAGSRVRRSRAGDSEGPDAGAVGNAADGDIGGLKTVGQRVDQPAAIGRAVE